MVVFVRLRCWRYELVRRFELLSWVVKFTWCPDMINVDVIRYEYLQRRCYTTWVFEASGCSTNSFNLASRCFTNLLILKVVFLLLRIYIWLFLSLRCTRTATRTALLLISLLIIVVLERHDVLSILIESAWSARGSCGGMSTSYWLSIPAIISLIFMSILIIFFCIGVMTAKVLYRSRFRYGTV